MNEFWEQSCWAIFAREVFFFCLFSSPKCQPSPAASHRDLFLSRTCGTLLSNEKSMGGGDAFALGAQLNHPQLAPADATFEFLFVTQVLVTEMPTRNSSFIYNRVCVSPSWDLEIATLPGAIFDSFCHGQFEEDSATLYRGLLFCLPDGYYRVDVDGFECRRGGNGLISSSSRIFVNSWLQCEQERFDLWRESSTFYSPDKACICIITRFVFNCAINW